MTKPVSTATSKSDSVKSRPLGRLEKQAGIIIPMLLRGDPERAVAKAVGGSFSGIQRFKERHKAELEGTRTKSLEQGKVLWIADRDARLAEYAWLYGLHKEELAKGLRDGDKRYQASMVRNADMLLKNAGDLLGQLPRRPDMLPFGDRPADKELAAGEMVTERMVVERVYSRSYEGVDVEEIG